MKKTANIEKLLRLAREESGAELVEFAMTALILMGLMVGAFGFMLAMYTYHFVSSAAQQGMRFAIVRGQTWSKDETVNCSTSAPPSFTMAYNCTASATDIQNYVQSLATGGITASNVTIDTTSADVWPGKTPAGSSTGCSTTNSQGCMVKVKVSYTFKYFNVYPLNKLSSWSMSATSEGVILQ